MREYLERRQDFSGSVAHAIAAELCLRCLLHSGNSSNQDGRVQLVPASKSKGASKKPLLPVFRQYALWFWARHCVKAEWERQSGLLQTLLSRFLAIDGENSSLADWMAEMQREHSYGEHFEAYYSCCSEPPHPIFIICTYGLDELVTPVLEADSSLLDAKNRNYRSPMEVAAYRGHLATLEAIIKFIPALPSLEGRIANLCKLAAKGSPRIEVMEYIMSKACKTDIDDDLVCSAANNIHCSIAMLNIVLSRAPDFILTETTLQRVVSECRSIDTLQSLLSRMATHDLTEDTFVVACRNEHCAADILKILIEFCNNFELTEEFVVKAMEEATAVKVKTL